MINVEIPGQRALELQYLVLDFNGTLAVDGKIIGEVTPLLRELGTLMEIHVITADTFGSAAGQLKDLPCKLQVIPDLAQDRAKLRYISSLGFERVVTIGNGLNDTLMLTHAALGIGVIQEEGASLHAMMGARVICRSITDALGLLLNPRRLSATLRN